MKKLLLSFIIALMIGCGDDVTNINGYTDEQVQAKIDSTLANMESETVTINDTIYQMTVDTVYKMVIDTVKEQMYDTLYKQVVDTVTNELVDTIYQRVIDTVYNELIDTIYQRVIDTVFKEIAVELPRDTTITLYDTTDGTIISKMYIGKVYKNVFYESKIYDYGAFPSSGSYYVTVGYTFYTGTTIYIADMCGQLAKPTWKGIGWADFSNSSNTSLKLNSYNMKGWRWFNAADANTLRDYLDLIIPENEYILLNVVSSRKTDYISYFEANVATSQTPQLYIKGKEVKYMCAYDLGN